MRMGVTKGVVEDFGGERRVRRNFCTSAREVVTPSRASAVMPDHLEMWALDGIFLGR